MASVQAVQQVESCTPDFLGAARSYGILKAVECARGRSHSLKTYRTDILGFDPILEQPCVMVTASTQAARRLCHEP